MWGSASCSVLQLLGHLLSKMTFKTSTCLRRKWSTLLRRYLPSTACTPLLATKTKIPVTISKKYLNVWSCARVNLISHFKHSKTCKMDATRTTLTNSFKFCSKTPPQWNLTMEAMEQITVSPSLDTLLVRHPEAKATLPFPIAHSRVINNPKGLDSILTSLLTSEMSKENNQLLPRKLEEKTVSLYLNFLEAERKYRSTFLNKEMKWTTTGRLWTD